MRPKRVPERAKQRMSAHQHLKSVPVRQCTANAKAMTTRPGVMARFNRLIKVLENNLANYETLKQVGMQRLILIMMGAGGLVAVLGGVTVVASRKK